MKGQLAKLSGTTIWYWSNCPNVGVPLSAWKKSTTLAPSASKSFRSVLACVPSASTISTENSAGGQLGVGEGGGGNGGVGVGVGVGFDGGGGVKVGVGVGVGIGGGGDVKVGVAVGVGVGAAAEYLPPVFK